MGTLADRLAARDAERFVGRERELQFFDDLLVEDPPANVVLVHGPGGIGKSTLLREVSRRAARRGWHPRLVEGRELAPAPGELERALDGVAAEPRPLVVFDTYERMTAVGGWLRRQLLPEMPAGSLVVLSGRRRPDPEWFQGGWEQLVVELEVGPFAAADARRLAALHGVEDAALVERLVEWAEGSPLALSLGADAARYGEWQPQVLEGTPDLAQALLRRVASDELDAGDLEVLAVASIARSVNARLLRGVLPDVDADEAEAWLRTRTFTETVGDGVALHDIVRKALRADLKARRPEQERELRRRLADHVHARAVRGEARLLADLADLVDNPALRWGMGAEGSVRFRVDALREDDLPELCERTRTRSTDISADAFGEWWGATERLLRAAPERAVVVRDAGDALCGMAFAVTPFNAPPAAEEDPMLAGWIAHARAEAPEGRAIIWRDSLDLTTGVEGDLASPILALLNTGIVLRSGLANPRWSYLPIDPGNQAAVAFARMSRSQHVPSLDIPGERPTECWILDSGPGGLLGGVLASVYSELGLPLPPFADDGSPVGAVPSPSPSPGITADDVRDALRAIDQPLELASSPLARGTTPDERAASVRAALEDAVAHAFGSGPDEQLLRDVLVRGYLDARSSHEAAWWELHLSRATYFRKLRTASARVAEWLLSNPR
jgi:hypothetical protein